MAIRDTLAFNEDQHALQDALRGFLARSPLLPRCAPRWRPRPVTARSCTRGWRASSA